MISTLALRYFAAAARCGSIRIAAEQLFVAPSAVSRQISMLEEEVEAPLFDRGPGRARLKLTPAGEALIGYVVKVENETRNVHSEIEALKGIRKGNVKIGAAESFSSIYLPQMLSNFASRHPGVTYDVRIAPTPEIVRLLMEEELDVGLCINPTPAAGLNHVFQRALRTTLLVPKGHPLYERETVRLSDCAEYGIVWPDASITARRLLDEMFGATRIRPRTVLTSNSFEMLRNSAKAGLGIAVVGQFNEVADSTYGGHRYVPIRDVNLGTYFFTLSQRAGRNLSTAALALIDAMKDELGNLAPDNDMVLKE